MTTEWRRYVEFAESMCSACEFRFAERLVQNFALAGSQIPFGNGFATAVYSGGLLCKTTFGVSMVKAFSLRNGEERRR